MRKYILLGLLIGIMPNICLGASIRYSQLIKEKQRKIEELEKCTGSTGKLKIAGISTLGLTAAGVAGNVVEAKKIKEYSKESEKLDKKLETARKEKEESDTKLADQVKLEGESKECMGLDAFKGKKLIKSMKKNDDKECVIDSCVKNASKNEGETDCECNEGYGQPEDEAKCVDEECGQLCNSANQNKLLVCESEDDVNVFECKSEVWKHVSLSKCNQSFMNSGNAKKTSDNPYNMNEQRVFSESYDVHDENYWFVTKPCLECKSGDTFDTASGKCKSSGS